MTKQMKHNWLWAVTTGIVGAMAITKLAITFNQYGLL